MEPFYTAPEGSLSFSGGEGRRLQPKTTSGRGANRRPGESYSDVILRLAAQNVDYVALCAIAQPNSRMRLSGLP